jgi:hypothetical protein
MNQALYAHMNNKRKMKKEKKNPTYKSKMLIKGLASNVHLIEVNYKNVRI